jgi:hypothetical protein
MSSQKLCPSPGSPAIRLLVLAVLLILSIPDANAYPGPAHELRQ